MHNDMGAAELARRLGKAQRSGQGWKACCPAHDDKNPSLVLYDKPDGVAFRCMAGCEGRDIWAEFVRLGFVDQDRNRPTDRTTLRSDRGELVEIVSPAPEDAPVPDLPNVVGWEPTIVYFYLDAEARPLFLVARRDQADGRKLIIPVTLWRAKAGGLTWAKRAPPAPRPLYGLDRLAARPAAPVLVVEGEKTADAAQKLFPERAVVSWQGGASSVDKADWSPLAGRDVTAWPDNDEAGRAAMAHLATILGRG